jgi:chemotaxis protein methyltransferase WspC
LTSNFPADLVGIADWLAGYSGISTTIIGGHSLKRAVQLRLTATGLGDAAVYFEHLLGSPEEQQDLVELVVVPETWFFRDRRPYAYLREHLARLLQGGLPSQPLRLLSAPCSTGEEPYSMAMTLLAMGLPQESFSIDAIDISRQSIRRARQAVYGKHSFRGVSEAEQQQHFQATAQGLAVLPAISKTVHFRRANLMVGLAELATQYDVIFCRNLLIYLEEAASQHLLASLAGLIKVGGLLIVGSAETGKVPPELFEAIREPFVFGYRRRDAQTSPPLLPAAIPSADPSAISVPPLAERERSRAPSQARQSRPRRSPAAPRLPLPTPAAAARWPRLSTGARERLAPSRAPAAAAPTDLQHVEQELARNPYSDAAYLQLALWMLGQNRPQEALESLQKCLYLKPDSREALQAMIQLTRQLGQVERSRQFQGRLARLEP